MAEKEGGLTKAAAPGRLALPPRSTYENIFRGGEAGSSGVSPGPMTLVSSFFAEEPESDCRSFLQLLAGAMASPAAAAVGGGGLAMNRSTDFSSGAEERDEKIAVEMSRPLFMLPTVPSPTGMLESPTFFLPGQGTFGISHQQALAQVTAHALHAAHQAQGHLHLPSDLPSTLTPPAISAAGDALATPPTAARNSDQGPRAAAMTATADGYNWRKYGQKKVKCSEFPRSYYKCTYPQCQVKKKVEKSLDGQVVEITYKGQHIHSPPSSGKRSKSGGAAALPPDGPPEGSSPGANNPAESENLAGEDEEGKFSAGQIVEQLSGLSDVEDMDEAEVRTAAAEKDLQQDVKKRKTGAKEAKEAVPVEPKIIVQTTSEVDLLDDGYRWRKYGQKVVKGNPNPRSYYKCTSPGCNARKHIERSSTDLKVVITTYERKHNHGVPGARSTSHTLIITDTADPM